MKNYLIYKITNRLNGKVYIGQTSVGLEKRWRKHVYNAVNHVHDNHFKRAIRKYGASAFCKEILIDGLTSEESNKYEELYIELYGTFEFGYNSTRGGDNYEFTPEVKRKISECRKGEKNPMYGRTGEKAPRYGRTHSEETKKRIAEAKPKTPVVGVNKDNGEVLFFESTQSAGRSLKIGRGGISVAARKNREKSHITGRKYYGGDWYWYYTEDFKNFS